MYRLDNGTLPLWTTLLLVIGDQYLVCLVKDGKVQHGELP